MSHLYRVVNLHYTTPNVKIKDVLQKSYKNMHKKVQGRFYNIYVQMDIHKTDIKVCKIRQKSSIFGIDFAGRDNVKLKHI